MHMHLQNEDMKPSFSAVINEDATLEIVSPREVAFHFKVGSGLTARGGLAGYTDTTAAGEGEVACVRRAVCGYAVNDMNDIKSRHVVLMTWMSRCHCMLAV